MWLGAALGAFKESVRGFTEWTNPENKRLRTVVSIDRKLEELEKDRDKLLAEKLESDEDKEKNAIDIGLVLDRIIFLRRKRRNLKR